MLATLTYSPLIPQNLAEIIRDDTCDTRRFMNSRSGICPAHATVTGYRASVPAGHGSHRVSPSYRALGPGGAGLPSGIEGHRSDATANYSLLTANSFFSFGNGTHTLYAYDSVSNITGIVNSAAMLPNGLGGAYSSSYEYDNLYRLTNAEGGWQGLHNLSFQTGMGYFANGRIKEKNLAVRRLLNGHSDTMNYARDYYYENPVQRNTLTKVVCSDSTGEYDLHYSWTPAGNMDTCDTEGAGSRRLCWDEQNRLLGVRDNRYLSLYQYDANGERTYKLTGKGDLQNISGEWQRFYMLDNATLYASPYLVATDKGYTKHYYAESERIASRIGGGGLQDLDQGEEADPEMYTSHQERLDELFDNLAACLDADFHSAEDMLKSLYKWQNVKKVETDCYWYHPDHLGSSSWITDTAGTAVQHLHYLPWGEDFVDQRTSSFSSMYTFSAKEKDTETGYSYFGSRYYSSDLSIWLSVDPMSDKYASLSPYTYCANNPVKLVDPDGEDYGIPPWLLIKGIARLVESFSKNSDVKTIAYVVNHPYNALRTGAMKNGGKNGISSFANNFSNNMCKAMELSRGAEGNFRNAIRHTLWQAMLTNELGAEQAERIGDVHESGPTADMSQRYFRNMEEADKVVDLLNNEIGRSIGERNKGADNVTMARKVALELYNNGLWTASMNSDNTVSIQKTRISKSDYLKMVNEIKKLNRYGLYEQ